jgi:hypothetical protein
VNIGKLGGASAHAALAAIVADIKVHFILGLFDELLLLGRVD